MIIITDATLKLELKVPQTFQLNVPHTTNGLIKKCREIMIKSKRDKKEFKQLPHINKRKIQDITEFGLEKVEEAIK